MANFWKREKIVTKRKIMMVIMMIVTEAKTEEE
jgi:hypothetical protein